MRTWSSSSLLPLRQPHPQDHARADPPRISSEVWLTSSSSFSTSSSPGARATTKCSDRKGISESEEDERKSLPTNRQLFRELPVERSVLQFIQKIGVGIPPSKRKRAHHEAGAIDQGLSNLPPRIVPPPPPFGPGSRVRLVPAPKATTSNRPASSSPGDGTGQSTVVPEVALIGRCNAGKSTLLNALLYGNKQERLGLGKGGKAAMSRTPGETKDVTVYHLSSNVPLAGNSSPPSLDRGRRRGGGGGRASLRLVDLPGYGFAHVASRQDADSSDLSLPHHRIVREYLLGRSSGVLKRILLLVDARHGLKRADAAFLSRLQEERESDSGNGDRAPRRRGLPPVQVVLTKCDLVPQADLARRVGLVRRDLADCLRREPGRLPVMLVSARSVVTPSASRGRIRGAGRSSSGGSGVLELQKELAALAVRIENP